MGAAPATHTHAPADITGTAVVTSDARLSDSRTPTAGSVVNASVAAGAAIAESKLALASDAAAGTASRRTLGTGALQAAAGNDARLSDTRTPTDGSVTDVKVAAGAAIAESKLALASDAAAGTASRRTLGTGALQACAGNDARLSDARTPANLSVTDAKVSAGAAIQQSKVAGSLWLPGALETMPRVLLPGEIGGWAVSGTLCIAFQEAPYSFTASKFRVEVASAASGLTLCRLGLFTANRDGSSITCVAASANTPTAFGTAWNTATVPFATAAVGGQAMPTSYNITAGQFYGVGILQVGTTPGKLWGRWDVPAWNYAEGVIGCKISGQSDLPLTAAFGVYPNDLGYLAVVA